MIKSLNIYILDREDLRIKSYNQCFNFEINRDYLTNEKSTFLPSKGYKANQGDFLLAKSFDKNNSEEELVKPLYFGVIDSFENNSIITCDLLNIVNFEFAATRKTGSASNGGFGEHLNTLFNFYLRTSQKLVSKISWTVDDTAKVDYSYQPSDPPTITNMVDYLINGFKKYNIIWEIDSVNYEGDNSLHISTKIRKNTKQIKFKNNTYSFVNFDIYVNDIGRGLENELLIISKNTADSENPIVLATFYLTKDGNITEGINNDVYLPTKTKVYIYDTETQDAPSFLEVAMHELVGNMYAHEINFDLVKTNNLISEEDLEIGILSYIVNGDTIYDSVLTGYRISSENNFIHLKFGHTRSTLREILN